NVLSFETALARFLVGFRERAFYIALESLGRYEHLLTEQQAHYSDSRVLDDLYGRLATARSQIQAADRLERSYLFVVPDQEDTRGEELLSGVRQELAGGYAQASGSVPTATAATAPLVAHRGFDPLELARQDRAGVGSYMQRYISTRLENVRTTR